MLATVTVHWFFAGLIALVPTQQETSFLVVKTRHQRLSELNQDLHRHRPLLGFRVDQLHATNKCEAFGGKKPEDKPGDPLRHLAGLGLCWLELNSMVIRIPAWMSTQSGERVGGRRRMLGRPMHPLPRADAEMDDFSWLSRMAWVDWSARRVDLAFIRSIPPPSGVVARIHLPTAEDRVCHLASSIEGGVEKIPYFHYVSLSRGTEALRPQALADAIREKLEIQGDEVKVMVNDWSIRLKPTRNEPIEILTLNLMEGEDGCGGSRTHAYDFLRFYDLAQVNSQPSIRDRRIPRAILAGSTDTLENDFCGSSTLKAVLSRFACSVGPPSSANNRPTCPLVVMDPPKE